MYEAMKSLAEKGHRGQFRDAPKGDIPVPYIEHPKAVVKNLLDWGEPENSPAIGIAWGHDLLEDTETSDAEILAASDETVLAGIRLLTRDDKVDKQLYMKEIARSGNREELLVKLSDRIHNSRDRIRLKGLRDAFSYMHKADCIFEAVCKLPADPVRENAIAAWRELDAFLRKEIHQE